MDKLNKEYPFGDKSDIQDHLASNFKTIASSKALVEFITSYLNEKDEEKRKFILQKITSYENPDNSSVG